MIGLLSNLDRRWIFLAMALCVSVPILVIGLTGVTFPRRRPLWLRPSSTRSIAPVKPTGDVPTS